MAAPEPAPAIDETADRPLIRLAPGRHKRIRAGHPWAYSNEIAMTREAKALPPGSIVRLLDSADGPLGAAMFNPRPLISARLLASDPDTAIDRQFLSDRLAAALALRERLFDAPYYRLAWSEADGLPGLVLDRYGDTAAAQLNTAGMNRLAEDLTEALFATVGVRSIVFRNDTAARTLEGLPSETSRAGAPVEGPVEIVENGVRFVVDLTAGQKTGWFYDHRENRARVAALARDTDVLDAYSYVGGFGIQAAAAGARSALCLDRSEPALDLAAESAKRNGVAGACDFLRGDVFRTLEEFGPGGAALRHRRLRSAGLRQVEEGPGERAQGLPQADPPRGGMRAAGRLSVRRLVLAAGRRRAVRRNPARRAPGPQARRSGAPPRRRGTRPPDPPLFAGERLSEGGSPATRLKRRNTCSGFSAAPPRPTSRR